MLWYSIYNEKQIRNRFIKNNLSNVTATLIDAYEKGEELDRTAKFLNFYNDNTVFDDLRITIYDNVNDQVLYKVGDYVVPIPEIYDATDPENYYRRSYAQQIRKALSEDGKSMFSIATSNDGIITVAAAVPYDSRMLLALNYNPLVWAIVLALCALATIISYAIMHRLSSVVNNLHSFALAVGSGEDVDTENYKFPHDEFGDVAREMIRLYREKDKAMQRVEHEHEVAMRANEEKARIKHQTANNLNHEIKTPVGVIKGYLDTIASDPEMPEKLRISFINKAREHADRLTALLKDVSSITRLEEGSQQVETTEFDFHDLVYNIASDLEVSPDIKGSMEFDWHVPFDTMVRSNYTLLNHAIMNLVRNAAKYSKGTVMQLKLVNTDSLFYTFIFADDGVGVGAEHLSRLFDRFYRVDEGRARKSGGTGLGLPIVKSTFQALGGEITVTNAQPHGLLFTFKIPRNKKA